MLKCYIVLTTLHHVRLLIQSDHSPTPLYSDAILRRGIGPKTFQTNIILTLKQAFRGARVWYNQDMEENENLELNESETIPDIENTATASSHSTLEPDFSELKEYMSSQLKAFSESYMSSIESLVKRVDSLSGLLSNRLANEFSAESLAEETGGNITIDDLFE